MKKWAVLACCLALSGGVAQAQDTSTGDHSELEKLIQSFRDASIRGEFVVAADPDVVSPFGGPSQLPPEMTAPIAISGDVWALYSSLETPAIPPPGSYRGLFRPQAAQEPEITSLFDPDYLIGDAFGLLSRIPPLSATPLTTDELRGLIGDSGLLAGEGDPFSEIVIVGGAVTNAPIPMDCPGQIMEFGRVDAIEGEPIWSGFAANDLFNDGSQAIVTRCVDGTWEVERLVNQGEQFVSMPTNAVTAVFPEGWLSFIPHDELFGSTGYRTFGFVTTTSNPFQPDTTGSTAVPFPGLADPQYLYILTDPSSYLPGLPIFSQPTVLRFSNGSCPPETWEDLYEINLVDDMLFFEQLGTGQLASGSTTDGVGDLGFLLEGSGPGFTEQYEWSEASGTYQFANATTCTWDVSIDDDIIDGLETALAQQVTTTTEAATTTTSLAETTSTVTSEQIPGEEPEATDSPLWPWILIGLGLIALGLGGFFLLGARGPCEELRRAWEAAERRRKAAQESLDRAREFLKERQDRVSGLEAELAALERSAQSSVTEHGVTYHAIEGGRVTSDGLQSLTANAGRDLADAQEDQADAEASVKEREGQLAEATKAADEAKAAYENCVGEHTPKASPTPEPATVGGGPAVAGASVPSTRACTEPDQEIRPAGEPETIDVIVDFSIFVEVEEMTERRVAEGKTLALDLSDLARDLDTLSTLADAYGGGRSVAEGVLGMETGTMIWEGGKLVKKGVEEYQSEPDLKPEVDVDPPTSPQDVVAEVLKGTAQLGAVVADKVSEWLEMNQVYRLRMTYFYQTITASPHQAWVCRDGRWVCQELIYEFTVGSLQKRPGPSRDESYRLESDMARAQMDRALREMVSRGRDEVANSARAKAEFEQARQPGPCP